MPATATKTASNAGKIWIQSPAIDLIVGCGAWSAPLLLVSYLALSSHVATWAIVFYALALFFNYPHYMATIYRAYHTAEDFQKYRIFTVHITGLLLLTALLSHFYVRMLPWIFTLYLTASPWHYSGQNYGLFMMFARRAGASPSGRERWSLYSVFLLTYAILFLNLHAGPSTDQLFVSLNLPILFVRWATIALTFVCIGLSAYGLNALRRQIGPKAMLPSVTLLSTQFLWFLIPSLLAASGRLVLPQSRYSTGVLAVMHSAQYLWITSYYAKREATTATAKWRPVAYFAVLIAGGIALFIPGPWLASYAFHFDFTSSFLIFTALVNLHHFILDGAIWKLRDGRIAGLLLNAPAKFAKAAGDTSGALLRFSRWTIGPSTGALALRVGMICGLVGLAVLDQTRFVLGMSVEHPTRLQRAASLNPYDASVQLRIAKDAAGAGDKDAALLAFKNAQSARPNDTSIRDQYLRFLLAQQMYPEAFQLTTEWLARTPNDADLLVNRGILANYVGNSEAAHASWEQALKVDPRQWNAHLYLAELLQSEGKPAEALQHFRVYFDSVASLKPANRPTADVVVGALIHMAGCMSDTGDQFHAIRSYDTAERIARESGDKRLQSLVASSAADFRDKHGSFSEALRLFQQALRIDSSIPSAELEARDLISYAELLREHHLENLAYACLLRAHLLMEGNQGVPEFARVENSLKELEKTSDAKQIAEVQHDPDRVLAQALNLLN
ncbi:TPR repeat protein [Candidatus Koribacter versatilis Ellin345]|uniref:TPR repeat protein n=1 Tax=Koribacter versatilis (strain Ellin345) TaxID=204669 RepID=Q1INJ4_KORVE|nr:tetratricopeptide repeat protein [Candidatus Koribacter versatilis]ABF41556.1 TPR repeat protein [Candidatus Koribacter versatilis Ellin345]